MDLFAEKSPMVFLVLSVLIGGGAAWLTGRALATHWRAFWQIIVFMALLALVVRFFHFALFQGTLLSLHYYIADYLVLLLFAALSFRLTRVKQMVTQYGWENERFGPFAWRKKIEPEIKSTREY